MSSLVIMPTCNEAANIKNLTEEILCSQADLEILIIDDNSPDGTGKIADQIAKIREWARDRARYASSQAALAAMPGAQTVATASGKTLDLDGSLDDFDNVKTESKKIKDIPKSKRTDDIITD